jgi:hypothetical protein
MSDPQTSELTPEARAIIRRARTSFLFSIGLLIIGFLAIGGALVFRSVNIGGPAASSTDYAIAALKVPAGAEVVSAVAADGKVSVTLKVGPMTTVRIFDGKSGELIREIPVVSE